MRARLIAPALLLLVLVVAGCASQGAGSSGPVFSSESRKVEQINSAETIRTYR